MKEREKERKKREGNVLSLYMIKLQGVLSILIFGKSFLEENMIKTKL